MKVEVVTASGKSKCRKCNNFYGEKLIPAGAKAIKFNVWVGGKHSIIFLCVKHAKKLSENLNQLLRDTK